MSEFARLIEERAPVEGEWSIETADRRTFTDQRDCFEARLGNFLRICAAAWHPAHLHCTGYTPQLEACGPLYAQSVDFAAEMREKIADLLKELESNQSGEAE